MSMLAEKKRKQKWSLNPRGNDWVQDSNKFGQKMLEKMGWQHGKGLGAKEDGITEHVKVSYKNDSKGMGYKESDDQWTEHETNFSALLESLSEEKPDEVKLNSLEKKSQSSRARVHYHKFTRGKDLSRYSEKDLANIFGKKTLKESQKEKARQEKTDAKDENNESESKFIFNGGSMRDYFKKKLPSFGKSNGYIVGHNGVLKKGESDSESEMRPSFSYNCNEIKDEETSYAGFGFKSEVIYGKNDDPVPRSLKSKITFVSYVNENDTEEAKEQKSKKKRKGDENEVDNVLSPKKKVRKPKEENPELEDGKGVSNPAFNPLRTPVKVQKHILDTIEESASEDISESEDGALTSVVTIAQIHKRSEPNEKKTSESINTSVIEDNDISGKVKKKSKQSEKLENGFINNMINITLNESIENEVKISPYEIKRKDVKKKKKEKKQKSGDVDIKKTTEIVSEVVQIEKNSCELKEKKKRKKKLENKAGENINVDLTIDDSVECRSTGDLQSSQDLSNASQVRENPFEVKVKKPKKKKPDNKAIENVSIDLTTDDSGVSSLNEEPPSKKNVKKKKEKKFALENPTFDNVLEESIDLTEVEENPYEVKVKKKKKNSKGGIDNLNFNESTGDNTSRSISKENPYEVTIPKKKKKKKQEKDTYAIENPNFNTSLEETTCNGIEENPYEVKPKKKKKKKENLAMDNPNFNANDSVDEGNENVAFKENGKKENNDNKLSSTLDSTSSEIKENISLNVEESDLMLNVVSTPINATTKSKNGENPFSITKVNSARRRKSVRFSDVTQERIIPNNDDLREHSDIESRNELLEINTQAISKGLEQDISFDISTLDKISYDENCGKLGKKRQLGLDNAAFDKHRTNLEENVESISKTIDRYEAEIENDINEKKLETLTMEDIMIGEVGNPHGEHEKLSEGTKLKFKYASFESRTPFYHLDKTGAKKSYKHLIKGDIVVGFKNTNLHEIPGYAARKKNVDV